jgi:DNA-directed RNA polymerase subunit RPC12/RpoP
MGEIVFKCPSCTTPFQKKDAKKDNEGRIRCPVCPDSGSAMPLLPVPYDMDDVENKILRLILLDEDEKEIVGYDFISVPWQVLDEKVVEEISKMIVKDFKLPKSNTL